MYPVLEIYQSLSQLGAGGDGAELAGGEQEHEQARSKQKQLENTELKQNVYQHMILPGIVWGMGSVGAGEAQEAVTQVCQHLHLTLHVGGGGLIKIADFKVTNKQFREKYILVKGICNAK